MKMKYPIDVKEHRPTGLLMATIKEVPGFIVHAHSPEELFSKLAQAFEEYMGGIGQPVADVIVRDESAPGYWPPAYSAEAHLVKEAA